MSEFEIPPKPIKFPKRQESKKYFWNNMVQQKRRNPNLSIEERVRISRERTADQLMRIRSEEKAGRDALTGLLNKKGFDKLLDKRIAEAKRQGSKTDITYLTIDVDDLKITNDSLGHDAGNDLLKRVALALKIAGGEENLIARTGGDEFAVVLTNANEENGLAFGKKVQETLSEGGHVSIGVALMDYSSPELVEASILGSDLAMLLAKATYKEGGPDGPLSAGQVPTEYVMRPKALQERANARKQMGYLKRTG